MEDKMNLKKTSLMFFNQAVKISRKYRISKNKS